MMEAEVRTALRAFVAVGGTERWMAEQVPRAVRSGRSVIAAEPHPTHCMPLSRTPSAGQEATWGRRHGRAGHEEFGWRKS
jgi:cytochrome c5